MSNAAKHGMKPALDPRRKFDSVWNHGASTASDVYNYELPGYTTLSPETFRSLQKQLEAAVWKDSTAKECLIDKTAEFIDGYDQWCEAEGKLAATALGDFFTKFHRVWARFRLQDGRFAFVEFHYSQDEDAAMQVNWSKAVFGDAPKLPNQFTTFSITKPYVLYNMEHCALS